jgi:alpha-D-xyloside xylohydrolase
MNFFRAEGSRIIWEREGEIVWIEPYGQDAIRFRASKNMRISTDEWGNILPQPEVKVEIIIDKDMAVLKNGKTTCEMLADGRVCYLNNYGDVILEEHYRDRRVSYAPIRPARCYRAISSDVFETDVYFKADKKERFYGMGQYLNDCLNLKGASLELAQKNTQCSIPFLLSSKGYGFIWNNPSIGRVELATNHTLWHSDGTRQIDYIIFSGNTPAEIVEKYTEISGRAPEFPEWASGLWQSKLRYLTQDELLEVAREYHRRNIPVSVIVCDYFHWPQQGDWKFDLHKWPDPKAMCDELEKMGMKLMVSIWPTVDPDSENYDEMRDKGYLMRTEQGVQSVFLYLGPETYYDATNPGARKYIWDTVKRNYFDLGVKMFWLDEAEPEMRPYSYQNVRYYLGNGREVSNIYPLMHAKAFYDGMIEAGEKDVVNLIRCCWIGSQRYGVVMWSGDCPSTFENLRHQIKAALNIGIAGIPWWTSDIGGFFDGDPNDPTFRELMVRWYQFGVFCPVFRMHGYRKPYTVKVGGQGSGAPNEIWSFGDEVYEILKKWLFIREKLRPYIMKQMDAAHRSGTPVIRPLFYDFPSDQTAWEIEEQYMFGPDILVAPVVNEGQRERSVYLPSGTAWKNPYTGEKFDGGSTVTVSAQLDQIPLFFRDGTPLPEIV